MDEPDWFERVYSAALTIPEGMVMGYGQLGDVAGVTARMAGRAMFFADARRNIPWWRVVGADGSLRIGRRDPALARLQRERLEAEGVRFTDSGRVAGCFFKD